MEPLRYRAENDMFPKKAKAKEVDNQIGHSENHGSASDQTGTTGLSQILWIDLRARRNDPGLYPFLAEKWPVLRVREEETLIDEIARTSPDLLCFEYDYPSIHGLSFLRQVRRHFPPLPIIMVTEQHSEALAVWALRNRLWDYLVKPLSRHELFASVKSSLIARQGVHGEDGTVCIPNPIPVELRLNNRRRTSTLTACSFVEKHCHEKILEKEVAALCGMNSSTFSRTFKKEQGITFRDYLIRYRIHRAQRLLENPDISIQDVAYTVGFRDPSYFTRMFRRVVGVSPSRYRARFSGRN